jgi:hypothetical protein
MEANETYDFHQSVIKFAIQWHQRAKANVLDPSAWWPVIPQWRDSFLRQPKPAKARLADTRSSDASRNIPKSATTIGSRADVATTIANGSTSLESLLKSSSPAPGGHKNDPGCSPCSLCSLRSCHRTMVFLPPGSYFLTSLSCVGS